MSGYLDGGQGTRLTETFDFRPVWTGIVSKSVTSPSPSSRWIILCPRSVAMGSGKPKSLLHGRHRAEGANGGNQRGEVDFMLCEAAYRERGEGDVPHHLTSTEAGQIAREVGARRLALTHIPPYLDVSRSIDEAEKAFDRPVMLAMPGVSFDVRARCRSAQGCQAREFPLRRPTRAPC